MSAKAACLIPARWTLEDYARHTCGDRSHVHISRTELGDSLKHGLVEIVRPEDRRQRRRMIVRAVRILNVRGLSCVVGAGLVIALGDPSDRGWALAMLAQVRKRREGLYE